MIRATLFLALALISSVDALKVHNTETADSSLSGTAASRSKAAVTALKALEKIGVNFEEHERNEIAKDIIDKGLGHVLSESFRQFHTPNLEGQQSSSYDKVYQALKKQIKPWVNIRDSLAIAKDSQDPDTQEAFGEKAMAILGPTAKAARVLQDKIQDGSMLAALMNPNEDLDLGDISAPAGMGGIEDLADISAPAGMGGLED